MQFTTLALAALASLASAQKVTVVTVGMNGTLTFTPNNIKVPAGEMVQFQFTTGNHTVTSSTFDQPCAPVSLHSNVTGFHSGFQPAAASAAQGMIPTYSLMINNTTPLWIYCAQATHCAKGMVMVINENTAANASRSFAAYKSLAATAQTVIPGSTTSTGGTTGTTGSNGTTTTTSGNTGASGTGAAGILSVPSTFGLLGLAAAVYLF